MLEKVIDPQHVQKGLIWYETGELQNRDAACTQKYKQFHYIKRMQTSTKVFKKSSTIRDAKKD